MSSTSGCGDIRDIGSIPGGVWRGLGVILVTGWLQITCNHSLAGQSICRYVWLRGYRLPECSPRVRASRARVP
jgi:hypothetical protein